MGTRHRIKQVEPLQTRLMAEAKRLREEAKALPDGAIRETMLRRAMQAETGLHICEWLRSPGLRPPE